MQWSFKSWLFYGMAILVITTVLEVIMYAVNIQIKPFTLAWFMELAVVVAISIYLTNKHEARRGRKQL